MYETVEIGPNIGMSAPNFKLEDHERCERDLNSLYGERGLLLGFIDSIWEPASIRRILFMQRHIHRFAAIGYSAALVVADKQYALYSFYMSSPMTVAVPLLADSKLEVHNLYRMVHPGLIVIDTNNILQHKWLMPDERVWPKAQEIIEQARA